MPLTAALGRKKRRKKMSVPESFARKVRIYAYRYAGQEIINKRRAARRLPEFEEAVLDLARKEGVGEDEARRVWDESLAAARQDRQKSVDIEYRVGLLDALLTRLGEHEVRMTTLADEPLIDPWNTHPKLQALILRIKQAVEEIFGSEGLEILDTDVEHVVHRCEQLMEARNIRAHKLIKDVTMDITQYMVDVTDKWRTMVRNALDELERMFNV